MYLISDQAWREAIKLLTEFKQSAHSSINNKEVNSRRRAGLLVRKLEKCSKITKQQFETWRKKKKS